MWMEDMCLFEDMESDPTHLLTFGASFVSPPLASSLAGHVWFAPSLAFPCLFLSLTPSPLLSRSASFSVSFLWFLSGVWQQLNQLLKDAINTHTHIHPSLQQTHTKTALSELSAFKVEFGDTENISCYWQWLWSPTLKGSPVSRNYTADWFWFRSPLICPTSLQSLHSGDQLLAAWSQVPLGNLDFKFADTIKNPFSSS